MCVCVCVKGGFRGGRIGGGGYHLPRIQSSALCGVGRLHSFAVDHNYSAVTVFPHEK